MVGENVLKNYLLEHPEEGYMLCNQEPSAHPWKYLVELSLHQDPSHGTGAGGFWGLAGGAEFQTVTQGDRDTLYSAK